MCRSKHATYIWENPEVHFLMVVGADNIIEAKKGLSKKCTEHKVPSYGWKLVRKHYDENSDPSMDRGVEYTDWDWIERNGL